MYDGLQSTARTTYVLHPESMEEFRRHTVFISGFSTVAFAGVMVKDMFAAVSIFVKPAGHTCRVCCRSHILHAC